MTTQHERDQETGFDYRGARFYDSDIARFLSLDPLAKEFPAWSAYNYVMGNPISLTDPTGKGVETDFLNKETGQTKHVDDGLDQIAMVDGKDWAWVAAYDYAINKGNSVEAEFSFMQGHTNAQIYKPNEFGMYQFPEEGRGFARYTTESGKNNGNNESYTVNGKRHTTDNWATKETFLGFYKTIQDFHSATGATIHYGDISAYNPKIDLGHNTHFTGNSIDIHYFDSNGTELRGLGAYSKADVSLTNSFFNHAQNNGFTKNYSYGGKFTHIGNNNQGVHKDHLHIGR